MRTLLSRPNVALALSLLALVVAMGGSAAAIVVTGAQIKDSSVTTRDIKNNSLKGTDLKNESLKSSDLRNGSIKLQDLSAGARGFAGFQIVIAESGNIAMNDSGAVRAVCPLGKKTVGGGGAWFDGGQGSSVINRNNPELFVGGSPSLPVSNNANAWYVAGRNLANEALRLRAYAVCAVAP